MLELAEVTELARNSWRSLASLSDWQDSIPAFGELERAVRVRRLVHELEHELKVNRFVLRSMIGSHIQS